MVRRDRRVRSLATGASLLVVALVFAIAPATADASLGDISTVAGGVPPGPVAATSVGQLARSVAAASFGGHSYVYVVDGANDVVTRIDGSNGQQQVVAGVGASVFSGDGGPATSAGLLSPSAVAVDLTGDVAISGGERVRYIPASSGTFFGQAMTAGDIYTIAGTGTPGYTGDGGPGTSAELNDGHVSFPPGAGIAFDPNGDLAIADRANNVVRLVAVANGHPFGLNATAGDIYTIAGNGTAGYSGDSAGATSAELDLPSAVAFDGSGDMAIADTTNRVIRFVSQANSTKFGQPVAVGDIYTIAGDGSTTSACTAQNVTATSVGLSLPVGVSFDSFGGVMVVEAGAQCVSYVQNSSAGGFCTLTADNICTFAGTAGSSGFSGDGGTATGAQLHQPIGVSVDASNGAVAIADFINYRVRYVPTGATSPHFGQLMSQGDIYTIAGNGTADFSGDGSTATASELGAPTGLGVAPGGGFAIGDNINNRIRFVPAAGGTIFGQAMTGGDMYTIAGNGTQSFGGDGASATSSQLASPQGVRFDQRGDLVLADTSNNRVRFVPAASGTYFGQAMTANDIYTIAGNGTGAFGGDGGAATAAALHGPSGVFIDPAGDLVIADTTNQRVRFVPAASGTYFGLPMTAGDIYTIAGTGTAGFNADGIPGTGAELMYPEDVAADPSGNILVADTFNHRLRLLASASGTFFGRAMTSGDIYTIAGTGTAGSSGDGGSPTAAQLHFPEGVTSDAIGDVAIADEGNNEVRFIPARSGVYFGPSMTAGDIYTIAGTGTSGFSGDGGPATSAAISFPTAAAFDATGDVLFADSGNNRIRMVSGQIPSLPTGGGGSGGSSGSGSGGAGASGGGGGTTGTVGKARVNSVTARANKVTVTMSCAGTAKVRCATALKLTVTELIRGGKVIAVSAATRKRTRKKVVVVGTAMLTLAGGQRKSVTVSLNRAGRALLAHRSKLKVTLTIVQGRTVIYKHKLTLTKPKPKKRRKSGLIGIRTAGLAA